MSEITIHDIAKQMKLSASTVSRALQNNPKISEKTRQRVQSFAKEKGYQPNINAANLRTKRTQTIGIIVPRIDRHYLSTVISGIEDLAKLNGYTVMIAQSREDLEVEKSLVTSMFNHRVDGLLVSIGMNTSDIDHFSSFIQKKIPLVFFDRAPKSSRVHQVVVNDEQAASNAILHFLEKGKKNIAFINGNSSLKLYKNRKKGVSRTLKANGNKLNSSLYFETELSHDAGRSIAKELLQGNTPIDAILCANDTSAVGVILEARKLGYKVPNDLSVVGFSDDPFCQYVTPTLSSISQPGTELGNVACQKLIDLINKKGKDVVKITELETHLIVRDSS